jgi:TolB-like protein/tetratricopeptide (TPR) repeat protein
LLTAPNHWRIMDRVAWLVSFLRELSRRRVVHSVLVYIGAAFIVLEATGNLVEALRLTDTLTFVCAILVVLGLPVVVVLSWAYQITPEGIRRVAGPNRRARFWLASGAALLGLMAVGGFAVRALVVESPAPEAPDTTAESNSETRGPILALLPFEHTGDAANLEMLSAALESQLEMVLVASPLLTVRSRRALRPHLDRGVPVDSVAAMLGVDYLIHANLTTAGGATRVVVQLTDARSMQVVASGVVEPGMAGSLELLDSVTLRIEDILRPALGKHVRLQRWHTEAGDSMAYRLHLQAHARWEEVLDRYTLGGTARLEADSDRETLEREADAVDRMLEQVVRRNPGWLEPWLDRATLVFNFAPLLAGSDALPALFERGLASVNQALVLAPENARALALRARLLERRARLAPGHTDAEADRDAAEKDLRLALDYDPQNADAAVTLSEILHARRRYDQAYHYAERAYRLDAYQDRWDAIVQRLAAGALELGDDAAADRWCREGLRREPLAPMHNACALAVMAWGDGPVDPDAAWNHYATISGHSRQTVAFYTFLMAAVLARAELTDSALVVLDRAREANAPAPVTLWLEAGVRFRMGDDDEAVRLFRVLADQYPAVAEHQSASRVLREYLERSGLVERLPG